MNLSHEANDLKQLVSKIINVNDDILERLFVRFITKVEFLGGCPQDFIAIKGIGQSKANQLYAAFQLAREINKPIDEYPIIRTPKDVYVLLSVEMRFLQNEHFICLFLSTKNHVKAKEIISIGSLNASLVHPREVFRAAIRFSSASIICVHNHPSGDPNPSTQDIEKTERLVRAGVMIGIEVLDHVIIGGERFFSLKEQGVV